MTRSAMKGVVSFADDNADLASANRRNFLMQAGTTAGILAAGMVLNAATPVRAAAATRGGRTQPRKSQRGKGPSSAFWPEQIKLDFDQLYEEAGRRRRMMAVSAHDRISGTPQMVRVWDAFLHYAKSRPGVAFLRKDEITRFVLQSPLTLRESETI